MRQVAKLALSFCYSVDVKGKNTNRDVAIFHSFFCPSAAEWHHCAEATETAEMLMINVLNNLTRAGSTAKFRNLLMGEVIHSI